jgi:LysR family hca operon transcriptional activator
MIELRHLRYFIAVAEELNFTRAAQRLHTAQPSLSQQIRTLEAYLGAPLLKRDNRKVELTAAGQRFLLEARLVLQQTERAVALIRAPDEPERLRIGFDPGLAIELFPRLLPRIFNALPGVAFDIRSLPPRELQRALLDDRFDVVFSSFTGADKAIVTEKLFRESLIAILPGNHPRLAAHGSLSLAALQGLPIIIGETDYSPNLRQSLEWRCAELGIELSVAHEVNNIFEGLALIMGGCGIGICGSSLGKLIPHSLAMRPLDGSAPQLDIAVSYRAGAMSKKLRKLLGIAHEIGLDMSAAFTALSGAA